MHWEYVKKHYFDSQKVKVHIKLWYFEALSASILRIYRFANLCTDHLLYNIPTSYLHIMTVMYITWMFISFGIYETNCVFYIRLWWGDI